ncbi:MAG: hypothetical protein CVV13_07535 [Gammaproteobacteria bacterium HGW-Gammaproteobacteria-3]|nr:MAG: hypothetical protein CVV13_07535 [Gammaproteobacteria bacterium HGW-Gammaproteobacteria-3]
MLHILRFFFVLAAAPTLILVWLLFLAVEPEPSTQVEWQVTEQDLARAKQIFEGNAIKDHIKTIELNSRDLNIALNYLLNNYIQSSSLIALNDNSLDFTLSLQLPENLLGNYLNLQFKLTRENGINRISSLHIGKIAVADELAGFLLYKIIKYAHFKQHYILVTEQILDLHFDAEKLSLTYLTDPAYTGNTVDLLHQARDHQAMIYYQQKLTAVINRHDPKWRLSLAELFQPLFKLAYQRSTPATAIKENRIVIFTVNSYVNKDKVLPYLPRNVTARPRRNYPVYLYKRVDMAKHFAASATVTATGGGHLANMIGMEKELSDARSGSGFSFIDLAGDRAGMRFGQLAAASPEKARKLQKYMSEIKDYSAFMPDIRDLPENLDRKQFKKQFFTVYTPQYQQLLQEIDKRIDALPLYTEEDRTLKPESAETLNRSP